jgi:hypothetical protein
MSAQPAGGDATAACLFCGRQLASIERHCPAFALAGVAAHAGCCGGCSTSIAATSERQQAATP